MSSWRAGASKKANVDNGDRRKPAATPKNKARVLEEGEYSHKTLLMRMFAIFEDAFIDVCKPLVPLALRFTSG